MTKRFFRVDYLILSLLLLAINITVTDDIAAATSLQTDSKKIEKSANDLDGNEDSTEGFEEDEESLEGFEEADDAFADIQIDAELKSASEQIDSAISFGGFFREEIAYSHEREEPEYSKMRSTLNLNLEVGFSPNWKAKINANGYYDYVYQYLGRDRFTDELLDTYESEYELRDVFIDGKLSNWLFVKIGRQIIAWGESDSRQITDMANPRDLRELGMVDIEDARIPVAASKITVAFWGWETNLVATHEFRPNKFPAEGSEFDILGPLRTPSIAIEEDEYPKNSAENSEFLVRLFKPFNGGDFSIIWADVFEDSFYLDFKQLSLLSFPPILTVVPRYKRIKVFGAAGNLVSGAWLYKAEYARKTGTAQARKDQEEQILQLIAAVQIGAVPNPGIFDENTGVVKTWNEKNLQQLMVGTEYSGVDDFTFTLELSVEQIEDYEVFLQSKEQSGQMAFGLTHTIFNDTFNSRLFWIRFADDNGDVIRVNIDYDIIDAMNISAGAVAYEASKEDAAVFPFRNNDRIFAAVKYSF